MKNHQRFIHPKLDGVALAVDLLYEGAVALAKTAKAKPARGKPLRPGQALSAGAATPLWNNLAAALKAECKKRGDQSKLARLVSLPRQRMHVFLQGKGPLPDAERALVLLQWLALRQKTSQAPSQTRQQ